VLRSNRYALFSSWLNNTNIWFDAKITFRTFEH